MTVGGWKELLPHCFSPLFWHNVQQFDGICCTRGGKEEGLSVDFGWGECWSSLRNSWIIFTSQIELFLKNFVELCKTSKLLCACCYWGKALIFHPTCPTSLKHLLCCVIPNHLGDGGCFCTVFGEECLKKKKEWIIYGEKLWKFPPAYSFTWYTLKDMVSAQWSLVGKSII